MPNMSYCRFQNTANDLADCVESINEYASEDEANAASRMYDLCKRFIRDYDPNATYTECEDCGEPGPTLCSDCRKERKEASAEK